MRRTAYSWLTDEEFIQLLDVRASTELEVEAKQRLQVHVDHVRDEQVAPVRPVQHSALA